jgi:tetratricopeptide (TPR) repeat protein
LIAGVARVRPDRGVGRLAAALVLPLVGGWVFWTAGHELVADFGSFEAQNQTEVWAQAKAAPASQAEWEAALSRLRWAQDVRGSSPVLHEQLGHIYRVGVRQPWASADQQVAWTRLAIQHYQRSVALRPGDGLTWAVLATAYGELGEFGSEREQALTRALQLAPNDNPVQLTLLYTVLAHWAETPEPFQKWVVDEFETGTARQRQLISQIAKPFGLVLESTTAPR